MLFPLLETSFLRSLQGWLFPKEPLLSLSVSDPPDILLVGPTGFLPSAPARHLGMGRSLSVLRSLRLFPPIPTLHIFQHSASLGCMVRLLIATFSPRRRLSARAGPRSLLGSHSRPRVWQSRGK